MENLAELSPDDRQNRTTNLIMNLHREVRVVWDEGGKNSLETLLAYDILGIWIQEGEGQAFVCFRGIEKIRGRSFLSTKASLL